jgi:predicted dehydrogenase
MQKKINWGVLGTGNIAHIFAQSLTSSKTSQLYAVGSRNQLTANKFAIQYATPKMYSSYDSLLADPDVQAVYIALPHSMHSEWTIKAAKAKKHILCEKPLTINYKEGLSVVQAVTDNKVFLMEAFVFTTHPQTEKLRTLIKSNIIGSIKVINATFSFKSEDDHTDRQLLKALGGGGILDVGCYPISMVRLIVAEILGQKTVEPEEIFGISHIDEAGIDERSICCAKFSGGILAQISCGISVSQDNCVKIFGTEGYLSIKSPWIPGGRNPAITEIILHEYKNVNPEIFYIETKVGSSNFMIDHFVKSMEDQRSWAFYSEEALMNMKTLDRWRASANVNYQSDNNHI